MQSNRNIINDLLRGGASIAVVLGHIVQILSESMGLDYFTNPVAIIIISINMPLFAIISGFYASKKTGLLYGIKKMKRLAIPLLMWTAIYCLYLVCIRLIAGHGIGFAVTEYIEYLVSPYYWFLWALIILISTVNIADAVTRKLLRANIGNCSCSLVISIFIMVVFSTIKFPNWEYAWFIFPFYMAGYIVDIDKIERTITVKHTAGFGILFILALIIYKREWLFYVSGVSILDSDYGPWYQLFYNCVRSVIGIVGCVFIIGLISCFVRGREVSGQHWLAFIGRNSLKVYCIQNIVVSVVFRLAVELFTEQFNVVITKWEIVVVSIVLTIPMVVIINMIMLASG